MVGLFAILLAALCPLSLAFSDTFPIITWSLQGSNIIDSLPLKLSTTAHSASLLENILFNNELCDHDAIVLIDQPGLHASDLRTLPSSSSLARFLSSATSSRQFPYVRNPSQSPFASVAQSISDRCSSQVLEFTPGQEGVTLDSASKYVIHIPMPHLEGTSGSRKSIMTEHDTRLSSGLEAIANVFPNHIVVFAGSSIPSKRRFDDTARVNAFDPQPSASKKEGGILSRFQLLTPGLITTLFIAFFILVPIVFVGISALASIQSPLRVEAPKGYNAQERKNQ